MKIKEKLELVKLIQSLIQIESLDNENLQDAWIKSFLLTQAVGDRSRKSKGA